MVRPSSGETTALLTGRAPQRWSGGDICEQLKTLVRLPPDRASVSPSAKAWPQNWLPRRQELIPAPLSLKQEEVGYCEISQIFKYSPHLPFHLTRGPGILHTARLWVPLP